MFYAADHNHDFPFVLRHAMSSYATEKTPPIARTNHEFFTAEFVLTGAGTLEINGKTFYIEQNGVYFLTPGSDHCYYQNPENPWRKLYFELDGVFMKQILDAYQLEEVYHIPDCPELKRHFEIMMALNSHSRLYHQQASLIFHQFAAEAAKCVHGGEFQLPVDMEMLKTTLEEAVETNFSLADYAEKHHVSSAHLIRTFRSFFQMTPYEYLMEQKMEKARKLLQYSFLSIKEIAEQLAFSDQYYFSNYFKQKNGIAPSEYRKKHGLYRQQ